MPGVLEGRRHGSPPWNARVWVEGRGGEGKGRQMGEGGVGRL